MLCCAICIVLFEETKTINDKLLKIRFYSQKAFHLNKFTLSQRKKMIESSTSKSKRNFFSIRNIKATIYYFEHFILQFLYKMSCRAWKYCFSPDVWIGMTYSSLHKLTLPHFEKFSHDSLLCTVCSISTCSIAKVRQGLQISKKSKKLKKDPVWTF